MHQGVNTWNSLPSTTWKVKSINRFKEFQWKLFLIEDWKGISNIWRLFPILEFAASLCAWRDQNLALGDVSNTLRHGQSVTTLEGTSEILPLLLWTGKWKLGIENTCSGSWIRSRTQTSGSTSMSFSLHKASCVLLFFNLFFFSDVAHAFCVISKNPLPNPRVERKVTFSET